MAAGFHPPLEEYLEAILELEEEGIRVIQARLAERMGHSAPAVSETVKRLKAEGWVGVANRSISLTGSGRERAESVVRKHRLAERLLTDVIGLPWEKAHIEACRWEHVISDEVEARLVELLGNPETCPHGNPIPGSGGRPRAGLVTLASVRAGAVRLERVTEQVEIDARAMSHLSAAGFIPGRDAHVAGRAADGTLTLQLDDRSIDLDAALAEQLYVSAGSASAD